MPVCIPADETGRIKLASGSCCCAFSLTFEANIDSSEYTDDPPDFGSSLCFFGRVRLAPIARGDGHLVWRSQDYSFSDIDIDSGNTVASPGDFFDSWHNYSLSFSYNTVDGRWYETIQIDSLTPETFDLFPTGPLDFAITFGNGGVCHRSYRNIHLMFGHETRSFVGDAFDNSVNATIIGSELRLDAPTVDDDCYAEWDTDQEKMKCCFRDVTEIATIQVSGTCTDGTGGSGECSNLNTRIDYDDDFTPNTAQFKLWFGTGSSLDPNICCLKVQGNPDGGPDNFFGGCILFSGTTVGFGMDIVCNGDGTGGTISIVCSNDCNPLCVLCDAIARFDLIPYTQDDVSSIIGTYTDSRSDGTCGTGCSSTAQIVVAGPP